MNAPSDPSASRGTLLPRLGLGDATLLVIGTIIGAGIFSTPGFVAGALRDETLVLFAWVVGGGVALAGALSYAELGAAWPRAGGHYVYMRLAYGPFWGFLDGWAALLVNFPGSIAAMSLALAAYLGQLIPGLGERIVLVAVPFVGWNLTVGQAVAVAVILSLSFVNYLGVKAGAWVQNVVTGVKVLVFAAFIVVGFLWIPSGGEAILPPSAGAWQWSAFGGALIAVMFTYFGWDSATYLASEIRRPSRNLPLAALWGTLIVMAIYVALNVIFLRTVPLEEAKGSVVVADLAARRIFGPVASRAVTAAVIVSILGGLNATVLTGPRITYAMAQDGVFFRFAGTVHPRWRTPSSAIWVQAGWAVVLALTGTFEALFTAVGFVITLLAGATAVGVLVLRRRFPEVPRPYRTWGAPVTPLLFAGATAWIGISGVIENPAYSLGGLAVMASAWPAYRWWKSAPSG